MIFIWRWPYELSMGSFNNDSIDTLGFVCFTFGTIANVIIILNLLISILGDSFDAFQAESQQIDCLDMAELVIELETMIFWNRSLVGKKYIQKCTEFVGENSGLWEGKIKAIFRIIEDSKKILRGQNKKIIEKIETIENAQKEIIDQNKQLLSKFDLLLTKNNE